MGSRLHAVHRDLMRELRRRDVQAAQVEMLAEVLLEMVVQGGEAAPRPSARTHELVRRWQCLIDRQYRDAGFDLMAPAGIGMSRSRLVHAFRDVAGVTPHRYPISRRVADAANLFVTTGMPVSEICFEVGFGSLARFYVTFSEAFGLAPGAYRSRYRRV
jgi:AraC-like DNA-binding protein